MKHVSILLLEDVNLGSLENARQGFLEANEYMASKGKSPLFDVQLVGISEEIKLNGGHYVIKPDRVLKEMLQTDIIIVPPVKNCTPESFSANAAFAPWIAQQYALGSEVASLCLGAFILGLSGLLDGRDCVTHWNAAEQFQRLFPKSRVISDKIITDDKGIYTGGGAFSSANLVLYLIEKNAGREVAVYCSKLFQIDMNRSSQIPFAIFTGQKGHTDEEIKSVQAFIENNYAKKISVDDLCEKFFIGRRTFERRFKKATSNTVVEYVQRVRVEAAKRELEKGRKTINEVMYLVGYTDTHAFRQVFKKYAGLTPMAYKEKYTSLHPLTFSAKA